MTAASAPKASSSRYHSLALVALFAFVPLVPTLRNGLVYDDRVLLETKGRTLSDAVFGDLFGEDDAGRPASGYYRPVVSVSYLVERWIHGGRPAAFHLTNALLYVAICLLLYRVLRDIPACSPFALPASILFAAHPIHSESICLVAGRTDPLAMLFFLLAAASAARRRIAAALGFFVAAQLSKESALALAPLLAAVPLLCDQGGGPRSRHRASVALLLGALAIGAGFLAFKILCLGIVPPPDAWTGEGGPAQRFLTFLSVLPRYAQLLLWPERLSITHPVEMVRSAADPGLWGGILIAVTLTALAVLGRGAVAIGAAFFLIPLLPASNVVPITYSFRDMPFPLFERYLFIPSAGAALIAAAVLGDVLGRFAPPSMRGLWLTGACAIVGVALGVRQWHRATDFRSDVALLESAERDGFAAEEVRLKRASALYLAGRFEEALAAYDEFLAQAEGHVQATLERAQLLADMAEIRMQQAEHHVRSGDAGIAEHASADAKRWLADATRSVDAVLERIPRHGWALEVKAALTALGGDLRGSAALYRRALECGGTTEGLEPNFRLVADRLRRRADAVRQVGHGRIHEALTAYDQAIRAMCGDNPPERIPEPIADIAVRTLAEYGDTLVLAGRAVQAASTYRWVLRHDPTQYRAHEGLAYLAKQAGDRALAYEELEKALRIEPDAFYALWEMLNMLREDGRSDEAREYLLRFQELCERKGIRPPEGAPTPGADPTGGSDSDS